MKITIEEDGSLLIDGEYDTTITKNVEYGQKFENGIFDTPFIKIEGGSENCNHEIINFIFQGKNKY